MVSVLFVNAGKPVRKRRYIVYYYDNKSQIITGEMPHRTQSIAYGQSTLSAYEALEPRGRNLAYF
jgi:hypothetical protein